VGVVGVTLKGPVHFGERDAEGIMLEGRHILDPPPEWGALVRNRFWEGKGLRAACFAILSAVLLP
jgi:hypothetical protein